MSQLSLATGRRRDGEQADSPRYTVRAVARRLGVPTATLRSWNQRYGIGPSAHSPGSHRLYSGADIEVVELMQHLIDRGANAASAARAALDSAIPKRADTASFVTAALHLDVAKASQLLERHIRHYGVCDTWDELIRPAFAAIDARQDDGDRCIDVEHALSWTVSRELQRLSRAPADGSTSIVLACTAGETHTLALEALRAALDERGHAALMLGADVPGAALIDAIERRTVDDVTVVLWSQLGETADIAAARAVLDARAHLVVGGLGWISAALPRKARRVANLRAALEHLDR